MSGRLRNSSRKRTPGTRKRPAVDAPFDEGVLRRAKRIARSYRIMLEPDEDGGYVGRAVEMPSVFGAGSTPNRCVEETREALISAIATMIEAGEVVPAASGGRTRRSQVNVRLTSEEKLILEQRARAGGFRGVSDYVRAAALGWER